MQFPTRGTTRVTENSRSSAGDLPAIDLTFILFASGGECEVRSLSEKLEELQYQSQQTLLCLFNKYIVGGYEVPGTEETGRGYVG